MRIKTTTHNDADGNNEKILFHRTYVKYHGTINFGKTKITAKTPKYYKSVVRESAELPKNHLLLLMTMNFYILAVRLTIINLIKNTKNITS